MSSQIRSVKCSLIKTFTLTNFIDKYQNLNPKFNFLTNLDDYSQYYECLEQPEDNKKTEFEPIEIDGLGPLMPLKRRYTRNSYWKSFRLPLITQGVKANKELFNLLPLKAKILNTRVKANNETFPANLYFYLFPFGSCCINMDIKINNTEHRLNELPELISNIKRSTFKTGEGSFEPYSIEVAKRINNALFNDEEGIKEYKTHKFIFLDTFDPLLPRYVEQKKLIFAIINNKNIKDVSTMADEVLNEIFKCELGILNFGETLLFTPKCTFISPSCIWIKEATNPKKINKQLKCMYKNYSSFLNVVFAVNRYLKDSFLVNKGNPPKGRTQDIINCFTKAFPETGQDSFDNNEIYFKKAFFRIAPEINLNKNLQKITQ